MVRSITSTNSTFLLSIAGLYDVPQQLQGYTADDAFAIESVQMVETMPGIDGNLSAAYVYTPRVTSVTLQADSASLAIFDNWASAMQAAREILAANAIITLPGIGMTYALRKGFLTGYSPMSEVKKTLAARRFQITWQTVIATPTV